MERCSIKKRNTLKDLVLRVSKSNKKRSSYNLCICATLIGIRAPGFEDRLQEKL